MSDTVDTLASAATVQEQSGTPKLSLGETLLAARERQNLTLEDVSSRMRLGLRQIKALEANRFSELPEAMITRGFIRNYAKLLQIDAEPLLESYRKIAPDKPQVLTIASANIQINGNKKRSWRAYIIASGLIIVGILVWLHYDDLTPRILMAPKSAAAPTLTNDTHNTQVADNPPDSPDAAKAAPTVPTGCAACSSSQPAVTVSAMPAATPESEQKANTQAAIKPSITAVPPAADSSVKPSTPAAAVAAPAKPGTPASDKIPTALQNESAKMVNGVITFTFSDTSWVSVHDRDNNEIFRRTRPAGSEDRVEGQPPLKVVIGNAAASQLVFNGKPVDLAPYTQANVAHVTLE